MTAAPSRTVDRLHAAGEIGGRTVQIVESGAVECAVYEPVPLDDGWVRVRTVRSAISPGTEMTFYGRNASNVYLHKRWNDALRIFEAGLPSLDYPVTFGYRAAGEVVESRSRDVRVGQRVYGNWRHTEFTSMPAERALARAVPKGLDWDDALDLGLMGPICVNALLFGEDAHVGHAAVVFGAGPVGLITAQIVRATGAASVYVVDRVPERLAVAVGLGLDTALATDGVDVAAQIKRLHGPDGVPVAWECTGAVAALNEAIRVVRRQGSVVAVGFYQGGASALVLGDEFHHNAVRIVAAQIGNPHKPFDHAGLEARTVELVLSGDLVLGRLPRHVVSVEDVARGFETLKRPSEVLQVVLDYQVRG